MLVDTSVWIEHLRRRHAALAAGLERGEVFTHPFVIGELACGGLRHRDEVLDLLSALPSCEEAEHEEVLSLVDRHKLMGSGLGWVDVHLLASARLSGERLWTIDRALARAARRLDIEYV
jgi:predicted nucleic acid-binding protein